MRDVRACVLGLIVLVVAAAGCGGDDDAEPAATTQGDSATQDAQNACPVDGCEITISDVQLEGQELKVAWSANFTPDFSKNHIHVYWDTFTAEQVSNDAAARNQTQGEWVPTDDYPEFVTEDVVSTAARGTSTTVCVTAGDRDHNVIDASIVDCRDVSALL